MKTEYIEIDTKTKLAYYSQYKDNSKIGIILVHGLAEHKGRYEDFINILLDNNISVFAVDLRGHGESSGRRGDIRDFRDYINDLEFFISHIKQKYPDLKFGIFGHSLGGLISSAYTSTHNTIDFLILSSPFLKASKPKRLFYIIPYKLLWFIKIKKKHSESKEMLEYSNKDILACHHYTLRLIGVMFKQGVNYATKRFHNIKVPVLMLGGKMDILIDSSGLESILNQFGSKNKTIKIYENIKHRVVQNEYKDEIIKDIITWINKEI